MKSVTYTPSALRVLMRMPRPEAERIRAKVQQYADDPASLSNNVKALQGREGLRLRVGDWRVIMTDEGAVLAVLKIGPRGGVYEGRGGKMDDVIQVSRRDYEALLAALADARDDLADIAAYDEAAARGEDGIPDALVARILDGEAPLRVFRDWRGLTQTALAEAAGVNRVQIANIEGGSRTGSVETLRKLASALRLTVDDLI